MSVSRQVRTSLTPEFKANSQRNPEKNPADSPKTRPFSVRLTQHERAWLESQAGPQHLGAYIRERLLDDQARKRRASRKPRVDDKNLAIVLALLGDQRIASNLNQLAKHANMGTLDVSDEVIGQIQEACAAMIAVRNYLLDIKAEDAPPA